MTEFFSAEQRQKQIQDIFVSKGKLGNIKEDFFIYSHFRNALRFHLERKRFRVCQLRMSDSRSFWKKALSSGSKLSSLRVTCRSSAARKSSLAPLFTPRVTALLKDRMDQV